MSYICFCSPLGNRVAKIVKIADKQAIFRNKIDVRQAVHRSQRLAAVCDNPGCRRASYHIAAYVRFRIATDSSTDRARRLSRSPDNRNNPCPVDDFPASRACRKSFFSIYFKAQHVFSSDLFVYSLFFCLFCAKMDEISHNQNYPTVCLPDGIGIDMPRPNGGGNSSVRMETNRS